VNRRNHANEQYHGGGGEKSLFQSLFPWQMRVHTNITRRFREVSSM